MSSRMLALLLVTIALSTGPGGTSAAQSQQPDEAPTLGTDDVAPSPSPAPPRPDSKPATSRPAPRSDVTAIAWRRSATDALSRATARQMVVVDVYTTWCGWCKVMDRKIYADARVARYATKHLFVKLDAEDKAEGQEFATQHRVDGFPMTIVLDSSGRVLARQSGAFPDAEQFLRWLEQARQGG
jgi:thiol:disulfide interchange protein